MAQLEHPPGEDGNGGTYVATGALTITRAGSTQREIDALPIR